MYFEPICVTNQPKNTRLIVSYWLPLLAKTKKNKEMLTIANVLKRPHKQQHQNLWSVSHYLKSNIQYPW